MGITLTSKTINSTYDSLLKLSDNDSLTGAFKVITDGLGNDTGISINNAGNVTISGTLVVNTKIQTPLIQLTGVLKGPSTFYIDPLPIDTYGDATVDTGKVVILGDLEVTGTTTTVNSTVVDIADLNLTLASNATTASEANGAGITIGGASATLTYASATDDFHFNKSLNAGTFIGALTGNVTGNVTGNADTASKWATARTITIGDTGKSVDGSANVSWTKAEIGITKANIDALNVNADTLDTKHATDFTLDYVTTNGSSTANSVTFGDLNANSLSIGGILKIDSNGDFQISGFDFTSAITVKDDTNGYPLKLYGVNTTVGSISTELQFYSGYDGGWYIENQTGSTYGASHVRILGREVQYGGVELTYNNTLIGGFYGDGIDLKNNTAITGTLDVSSTTTLSGTTNLYYTQLKDSLLVLDPNGSSYSTAIYRDGVNPHVLMAGGGTSTQWNTAYGWGDHSLQGYLTGYSETDTLQSVTTRGATTNVATTFQSSLSVDGVLYADRNNSAVNPPSTTDHSQGTRIILYDSSDIYYYSLGIENSTMWFNTDTVFKWYARATEKMKLDGGNLSVSDSAQFEGTTNPIRIGDGFGSGGSATIHKYNATLYLQYNNGQTSTNLNIGGGGTACTIHDAQNSDYHFASGGGDSYFGHDLGIGTTSPLNKLHVLTGGTSGLSSQANRGVNITDSAGPRLTLEHTGATSGQRNFVLKSENGVFGIAALNDSGSAWISDNILNVKYNGNVGIGTTSPRTKTHISSTTSILLVESTSYNANSSVWFTANTNGSYAQDQWELGCNISAGSKFELYDRLNGGSRFVVDHSGNVGIGTNSPYRKLQVDGGMGVRNGSFWIGDESGSTNDGIEMYKSSSILRFYRNAGSFGGTYSAGAVNLDLYSGSSYNTRISSEGNSYFGTANLGVGTTSPYAKLQVNASGKSNGSGGISEYTIAGVEEGSGQATIGAYHTGDGYANLNLSSSGGTAFWHISKRPSSDGHKLEFYYYSGGFDSKFEFLTDGTLKAKGDVIAYKSSDKRLKDNIKPIKNAIDKVKKIGGYEFDWNDNQDVYEGHDVGVIAQEIEEVLPEVVTERDNGYKAVKYEKLVALLIQGMKEQQEQIDELKRRLDGITN